MRSWGTWAILAALSAGCAPNLEHLKPIAEALAKDQASACVAVWVGVGTGAVVPAPAVPIGGGWGYVFLARTNQPGSRVTVTNVSCTVEHGTHGGAAMKAAEFFKSGWDGP